MRLKKNSVLLVAIVSLFLGSGFLKKVKPRTVYQESWIGTINYTYTIGDKRAVQEGDTKTEFELTRNTEITINVTGNRKGFATIRHNMRQWEKITAPFVKEEKYIQITERTENSVDSGEVDVDVEINDQNQTYWLKTSGPSYKVESTSSFWTSTAGHGLGPPQQGSSNVDGISIDAPDQQFGQNRNEISGSYVISSSETHNVVVSWDLLKEPVDAVLIVSPSDYDDWLPKPGPDEFTVGSVMDIDLKLQRRNGQPSTVIAKTFELRLSKTSKEPGITLNAPLNPIVDLPDLRFMTQPDGQISEEYQVIKIPCRNGLRGNVKIGSYDGGGWTTLTAIAILEDGTRIKGSLQRPGGKKEIPIPKREPVTNIGTAWLIVNGDPADTEDEDTSLANNSAGDGLSAYEEYRGFITEGKFQRFDPNKKELGVIVKRGEFPLFSEGISWFENASDIKVVRFYETEIGGDRRLNKNEKTANFYKQYVLRLENGNLPDTVLGQAFNGPDIPAVVDPVAINFRQIDAAYQRKVTEERPTILPFTLAEYKANTVAHELAHAVSVRHHGIKSPVIARTQTAQRNSNPPYRIFNRNGGEVTDRPRTLSSIGTEHDQQSGDLSCVLNYNPYNRWAFTIGADGASILNQVPLLPIGSKMCSSTVGTGINALTIYFGDAMRERGNCLSRIKLKP